MLSIMSDVATSATALGGLILVFLGSVIAGFDSYPKASQKAVLPKFKQRARFSLAGFLLALSSAASALIAEWLALSWLAAISFALLVLSFLAAATIAVNETRDIK